MGEVTGGGNDKKEEKRRDEDRREPLVTEWSVREAVIYSYK